MTTQAPTRVFESSVESELTLEALTLTNFKSFSHCELTLDPQFTLLIGANASGKTAILDGIAVALSNVLAGIKEIPRSSLRQIRVEDVRVVKREHKSGYSELIHLGKSVINARLRLAEQHSSLFGKDASVRSEFESGYAESFWVSDHLIQSMVKSWIANVQQGKDYSLPLIAYYGTGRLWRQKRQKKSRNAELEMDAYQRWDGYLDCLASASNLAILQEWMRRLTYGEIQRRKPIEQLRAVERAVKISLSNPARPTEKVERFYYDISAGELRVEFADGRLLPLNELSDGYRTFISMVADMAWRAVVLNPHMGESAAERVSGIVLIDELDLHLHPTWQRRVITDLCRTFPLVQFVATSHSPQILASLKRTQVRKLSIEGTVEPVGYVEGRDSNSVLYEMGDQERAPEWAEKLHRAYQWLEEKRCDEVKALVRELEDSLGETDTELVRLRWELHEVT